MSLVLASLLASTAAVPPGDPAQAATASEMPQAVGESSTPIQPFAVASAARMAICSNTGSCEFRLTAVQLVATAEKLVLDGQYAAARPLVDALAEAPGFTLQHRFLSGMIAAGTGDRTAAEKWFRKILDDSPGQTRVRLELAKVLLAGGKEGAADYHLRLAENDGDLPEEIARTVHAARSLLRGRRNWNFSFDIGFAPDSNINNGSKAETVDINFGPFSLPLTLNDDARSKSGIGQTGSFRAGVRLGLKDNLSLLIEGDGRFVNYKGKRSDDFGTQLAIGPEFKLSDETRLSAQFLGDYRWYGGRLATRDFGMQFDLQHHLAEGQRVGLRLDARRNLSKLSDDFSGSTYSAALSYDRVVARSFIASTGLFGSRSTVNDRGYSYWSAGIHGGIGGELPFGVNGGVSGSLGRAFYDAPLQLYSTKARNDWRFSARAYVGLRKLRFMGFSPSVEYNFSKVDSSYDLYRSDRHRAQFKLSRYF